MKHCCALLILFSLLQAQAQNYQADKHTFYIYWGWNLSSYTNSDISFAGDHHNFTLYDVEAQDRPSAFTMKKYFGLRNFTIPQYNVRIGYVFRKDWDLSIAIDHMKYVMQNGQTSRIDGYISNTETSFDRTYDNEEIALSQSFLRYEHTDGLNYGQISLRHHSPILSKSKVNLTWLQGVGIGIYTPRSDIRLINYAESDKFHLAGLGLHGLLGLRLSFFQTFFLQSEVKAGYVNLPWIISGPGNHRSKQQFFFLQQNLVFGSYLRFRKKK